MPTWYELPVNLKGEDGAQGPPGQDGDPGAPGTDGVDGVPGTSVTDVTHNDEEHTVTFHVGPLDYGPFPLPAGRDGEDGAGVRIAGDVLSYADLPDDAEPGDAWLVRDDGLLYVAGTGGSFPDEGNGVPFKGPQGERGIQGEQGARGTRWTSGVEHPTDDVRIGDLHLPPSGRPQIFAETAPE